MRRISLELVHGDTSVCFVGTRAAFGAFHPHTALVDAGGALLKAETLVQHDDLSSIRFESAIAAEGVDSAIDAGSIWQELKFAGISNEDEAVFRTINSNAAKQELPAGVTVLSSSNDRHFIAVNRKDFCSALDRNGLTVLFKALQVVRATAEGLIGLERENYPLSLWLLLYLAKNRTGYSLTFDSLQHSSGLAIDLEQTSSAIERLRTAFVTKNGSAARIVWEDNAWNPISSGFLLAGS